MTARNIDVPVLPSCSCGQEIPANVTLCVVCSANVGFPNVRYSERKEERAALDRRVADARISSSARGSLEKLEEFGRAVANSKAVVNRSRADFDLMLAGDGNLMQAYHPAVRAGLRIPQNNEFDPERDMHDSRINPHFYQQLHFAALSLDGKGVPHYGEFAITLRDAMIAKRTTVFEENPIKFNEKYPPGRNKPIPFGYRAVWLERNKLAMAKLHSRIDAATVEDEFADILLEKKETPDGNTDFIEAHIFGAVHPRAFEHVIADVVDDEVEVLLWQRMKLRLEFFGITFEEVGS